MRDCSAIYLSTLYLQITLYCCHRFVCSHSSWTLRDVDIFLETLIQSETNDLAKLGGAALLPLMADAPNK